MRPCFSKMLLSILLVFVPAQAFAQDTLDATHSSTAVLEEITVTSDRILLPTRQAGETVYTGTEITTKGIETQGAKAATSVYETMAILPGVSVEGADPYGLGAEQRSIRVRGVRGYMGAMTVEGVPNYGGNPIGPRDYLYDTENFRSISVYKGAVPGDIGTGVGSRGGAIVLRPLWPEEEFGLRFSQSLGSDSYHRTFMRVDSGALSRTGTRLSASYSYSQADKWKGPGKIGPRNNFNFSITQNLTEKVNAKFWLNYNELDQNLFRPLDIDQAKDLSSYRKFDYNSARTGIPAQDIHYYRYNKGSYKNTDMLGIVNFNPGETVRVSFKPYLSLEDTEIYQGTPAGGGRVQKRQRDINRKGFITEGAWKTRWVTSVVGYHYENIDMDISSNNYSITQEGLEYSGGGIVASPSNDDYVHSPYLKLAGTIDRLDWQTGLKYFRYEEASSKGYLKTGNSLDRAPDLDRQSRNYDIWLPTAGIGFSLSDNIYLHASYGKNFIRPYSYMPLVNLYHNNRPAFQAQNITLNDLFAGYDMEESDSFDLGVRISSDRFDIAPTLFYARHKNLLTPVYDPRVDLTYDQYVGKATGYGLELESNFYLRDNLTLFINPTCTILEYDQDLTFQGETIKARNNQVIDTPRFMVKSGLIFSWKDLEVIPSLRFIGKRYGDVEHDEAISSYTVVDFKANYLLKDFLSGADLKLSMELTNIFDKKYISNITASDFNRGGSASYYAGSPFAAVFSASIRF